MLLYRFHNVTMIIWKTNDGRRRTGPIAQGAALSFYNCLAQLGQASHQQHHITCHDGLEPETDGGRKKYTNECRHTVTLHIVSYREGLVAGAGSC